MFETFTTTELVEMRDRSSERISYHTKVRKLANKIIRSRMCSERTLSKLIDQESFLRESARKFG